MPATSSKVTFVVLLLVVAARLALADAHEPAPYAAALLRRPPKHPDVKADDEQGRAKPEQERRPGVAAFLDRFGADLDPVIDQKGFQTGVHEGGQRGREGAHRFGARARRRAARSAGSPLAPRSFRRRRVGDRRLEAARDGLAPAVDRLDVALSDLLLEQGIGHGDRRFRARHEEPHQQVVREQDEHEP